MKPCFHYKMISGLPDEVDLKLREHGYEGWLLNGLTTCVFDGRIIVTCVLMRTNEQERAARA